MTIDGSERTTTAPRTPARPTIIPTSNESEHQTVTTDSTLRPTTAPATAAGSTSGRSTTRRSAPRRPTVSGDRPLQRWTTLDSPIGQLLLTAADAGLTGLYMERHINPRTDPTTDEGWIRDDAGFEPAVAQLRAYFAGELTDFDLELSPVGTPFQLSVWSALRTIGYGETRSYGSIALQIGRASASRAVGMANGRNPISIIVPCHRVIGSSGQLTGYGGGLPRKRYLLDLERERVSGASTLV